MPRQPDEPGKAARAPTGAGVADAFARLSQTLDRASNRGKPASANQKMANQRMREALNAFGATIGQSAIEQSIDPPAPPAYAGKTIDTDRVNDGRVNDGRANDGRAIEAGRRIIGFACPVPSACGGAG
jgi:hypothetical protein